MFFHLIEDYKTATEFLEDVLLNGTPIQTNDKDNCIMCNMCSLVCPHAVIRPFLLNKEEEASAPSGVKKDLLDSSINDHQRYLTSATSGTIQLMYGFLTPIIIEKI